MRIEPGAELPRHGHPSAEPNMCLEGEVEIEGKKYGPGSYFYTPPAIEHGPFKAGAKGWIVFCAFDGPIGIEEAIGISTV
jgi:anti-sigma factor ChrR (cupin superfamily)